MIRTRFAPSPNGPLHLGHAYAAVMACDLAQQSGGEFLLRIEDIDGPRSRRAFVEEFSADLEWLGLHWDGEMRFQSQHLTRYEQAAHLLRQMGVLYPCHCTRTDISAAATSCGPDGPIYPGTCKGRQVDAAGAAWRLDMETAMALAGPLHWHDALAGEQRAAPEIFGDVVLVRKDLPASYHLAATLDDAADGITLVTRGRDLFSSTHIHRLLQELLNLPVPRWHHHGLLLDKSGAKLAKRRGSPSLADRRRAGEDGLIIAASLRDRRFPAGISLSDD